MYVKTNTILDKILAHKQDELNRRTSLPDDIQLTPPRDFIAALRRDTVALIAEVKKASPSKGVLIENFDPVKICMTYNENGASAISVLTDERFFQGHLDYLHLVKQAVDVPVLRKDFIIDGCQVDEARAFGADAVLLIVAALDDPQIADLHAHIVGLGMSALVEVHNEAEMERALKLGASLIGINNRDLKTFEVDLGTTARLAQLVPAEVVLVAESGVRNAVDVRQMGAYGAHAVLVGESLVKSDDLPGTVRAFSTVSR